MLKTKKFNLKKKKGLTLIEVLAVIIILAIIASIAVPAYLNTVSEQRAKSFRSDLSAIESQAVKLQPITSEIDYDQLDTTASASKDGSGGGTLDKNKILALANNGELPKKQQFDTSLSGVLITLKAPATTGGDVTGQACQPSTSVTACTSGTAIDTELANQLASIYLTSLTSTATVTVQARPVDMELIYTAQLVTGKPSFPKTKPTIGFADAGAKYQGRKLTNITASLYDLPKVFPSKKDDPGFFLLVEGQTLIYTGNDARINNTQTVHTASAYEKK